MPATVMSIAPAISSTNTLHGQVQPNPSILGNKGPATLALSASMTRGGLAPTHQQLQLTQNPLPHIGGQPILTGGLATVQQRLQHPMAQTLQGVPMIYSQAMLPHVGIQQQQGITRVMSALNPQLPPGVPMVGIGGQLS